MVYARNNILESRPFIENNVLKESQACFANESERIAETGEKFTAYLLANSTRDGVLFKTIKEITVELNIPHQTLSKVLKALETNKIIYRRNGIIGLWRE